MHSPPVADTFSVEAVLQQMLADDDQDIPLDEPGLELEAEDDSDNNNSLQGLDHGDTDVPECDMVYVLSAKYALPEPADACPAVDVEGDDGSQLFPKEEDSVPQFDMDSALKKLFMMFSKPNLAMLIRPYFT